MKLNILLIISLLIAGCSTKKFSENEFQIVWEKYIQKEFEESFDEKQSIAQRERIIQEILSNFQVDIEEFKTYMMKNHEEKYKKIFIE